MPVTNAGRDFICDSLNGTAGTAFGSGTYIGVGASSTAFAASQTDLITTPTRKQVDGAPTQPASNTMRWVATFATGDANIAWNEWGIFNAASSGTMLSRKVESLGTKTVAQTWQFTVDLTLTVPAT